MTPMECVVETLDYHGVHSLSFSKEIQAMKHAREVAERYEGLGMGYFYSIRVFYRWMDGTKVKTTDLLFIPAAQVEV